MADLTVTDVSLTAGETSVGADVPEQDTASGGDRFPNDGNTFVRVKNGAGGTLTVTFNSQQKCNFGFDHDLTVAVMVNMERVVGPFPRSRFNDEDGFVNMTYSGGTPANQHLHIFRG